MKNILILIAAITSQYVVAQYGNVGINTTNPSRKLHVVGDIMISKTSDRSEFGTSYPKVLVTNSKGDVDYVLRDDFLPPPNANTSKKEVFNSIYTTGTDSANPSKSVTCGKFIFLFENDTTSSNLPLPTDFRFKLKEAPTATIQVNVSMEQTYHNNGFQFFQGTTEGGNESFIFDLTPSSINYWDKPHDFAASNVANFEQNVIYLQYPNDAAFYRLNIYKVKQQNTWDFVTACEKF